MIVSVLRRLAPGVAIVSLVCLPLAACRRKEPPAPPLATPSVTLNRDKAPLGSPIEMTFKFAVAPGAQFTEDLRVMVHVVDTDEQMIFALDHNPPVPTSRWKPGETIEYTRTEFVPIYPYIGDASVQLGLYSLTTQQRVPLEGDEIGQRAYRVARFQLQPQTDSVYTVFKEGWHPAESSAQNARVEWQWTRKTATLAFKNPKRDSTFYLDVDNPGGVFEEPQEVQVSIGGQAAGRFTVTPKEQALHKIPLKADQMGTADMVELQIEVDKSFVPAQLPSSGSKDPRELGIRVFHAFVQPNK
jgi:hypothetical protein